jgi:hypothetical protein
MKQQTIHIHRNRGAAFSIVPKALLNNPDLSWKAKGILAYLIGKPDSWKVRVTDLVNKSYDKYASVKSGLKELREAGYASLECVREEGKISEWIWHISDEPCLKNSKNAHFSPEVDFQLVENQQVGIQQVENPTLSIKSVKEERRVERKTINKRAEKTARDNGIFDFGSDLVDRWCQSYQQWFNIPYLASVDEKHLADNILSLYKCRPKDILAFAFRMWINTANKDFVKKGAFDPQWYQIKASRDLLFFLRHLTDVAQEQSEPLDCSLKVPEYEFRELQEQILKGRPR